MVLRSGIDVRQFQACWSQRGDVLMSGLVFLLGAVVYANSFPGAFILDDVLIVDRNPLVHSIDLRTIFTSDYWGVGADRGLYRPITILSFALNTLLLGPEPWGYHLVNVLLHAWVSLAFFQLMGQWCLAPGPRFVAAALFALHPIHTEVVNEVIGRSELLVALFYLHGLRFCSRDASSALLVGILYSLALLSKEHAITFLGVVFLWDAFSCRVSTKRLPIYLWLLAITIVWLLLRELGVDRGTMGRPPFYIMYSPLAFMPVIWRILTALKIQVLYLGKLFWPVTLQSVYSGPAVDQPVQSMFSPWGGGIALTICIMSLLVLYGWRKRHLYALAIVCYLVSFSVTANIFFPIEVAMAERFAYLPSLWFCMAVVTGLGLLSHCCWPNKLGVRLVVVMLLLGGAGYLTWMRNRDYRDGITLFTVDFARSPKNLLAGIFLGDAYMQKGDFQRAEQAYRQILAAGSTNLEVYEDLAWSLLKQDKPQEAARYALIAVQMRETELSDKVLMILGESYSKLGQPQEVLRWLDLMPPGNPPGYFWELRGRAYEALDDLRNAVDCYFRVGEPPLESDVPHRLERLLRQLGETEEADRVHQWILKRGNAPVP